MIEAELKARVRDVEAVQHWLRERATEEPATYHDTYYDWPDHRLDTEGREIRLRTINTAECVKHLLTYKLPSVDQASGSKPEYETSIAAPEPVDSLLRDLGLVELVSLTKHCFNYQFEFDDRTFLATLVTVPELEGTFLEIETISNSADMKQAVAAVESVMIELELATDLVDVPYTDSVLLSRGIRKLTYCESDGEGVSRVFGVVVS